MIYGIGIDLIEIKRIEELLSSKTFLTRIAHPKEILAMKTIAPKRLPEFWAARFAAKEAFSKAYGTGIGKNVAFKSVGILNNSAGKPELIFDKKLTLSLKKMRLRSHVSLTHTKHLASAVVVLESTRGKPS